MKLKRSKPKPALRWYIALFGEEDWPVLLLWSDSAEKARVMANVYARDRSWGGATYVEPYDPPQCVITGAWDEFNKRNAIPYGRDVLGLAPKPLPKKHVEKSAPTPKKRKIKLRIRRRK